jgi:hypothetical protein
VLRTLVELVEERTRGGRDDGRLVVVAGECPDGVEVVEQRDRDELDAPVALAAEEIGAAMPADPVDSGQDLRAQQLLVPVGVLGARPAVPESRDHASLQRG